MSIYCWLGFHHWEFRDLREGPWLITEGRCRRLRCRRYPRWGMVNRDLLPRRRPW